MEPQTGINHHVEAGIYHATGKADNGGLFATPWVELPLGQSLRLKSRYPKYERL